MRSKRRRRNPTSAVAQAVVDYLDDEGAIGLVRSRASYERDIDDIVRRVVSQFASSADPDTIRDHLLDVFRRGISSTAGSYAARQAAAAAKSDAYAASAIARVIAAQVAAWHFGSTTPVDYDEHVREIAWLVDDMPVELVFGDPPGPLDTWRGWLRDFWRNNDHGQYFDPLEVQQILNLQPGQEHHLRESAFSHSVLRRLHDASEIGASSGASTQAELALINAHRRKIGMRPLDPAAAGWSDDDVRIEAQRLRTQGNPRAALLAWA